MKTISAFLVIAALGLAPVFADDLYSFTSADGTKSFKGVLLGYNQDKKTVKVRHQRGKIMTFKISHLAEKDHEYIKERAPILAAADGLSIDTDMNRKKVSEGPVGQWICEKTDYSYDVSAVNRLGADLGEVTFDYSIFVERDRRDAEKRNEVITGSHDVSAFLGNGNESFTTSTVTLENWSDNPPIPSGGGGG